MERIAAAVPQRTIKPEGILAVAVVECHKSRLVAAVGASRRSVVEHVVDPYSPEQTAAREDIDVALVEHRLTALGQPARIGLGTRIGVVLLVDRAALAVAYARVQALPPLVRRELLAPHAYIVGHAAIPAYVLAEYDQIGHEVQLAVGIAARDGKARGVGRLDQRVELPNKGQRIVALLPQLGEYAPHHDRGVVVVLADDLHGLTTAVIAESLGREIAHVAQHLRASQRQVDPHQHTAPVAPTVQIVVVRRRERPQRIGAQILHHVEILVVVALAHGAGYARPVVSHVDAVDIYRLAVDAQAVVVADRYLAEARYHRNLVRGGEYVAQTHTHRVERRRRGAPQRRTLDREGYIDRHGRIGPGRTHALRVDRLAFGREYFEIDRLGSTALGREPYRHRTVDTLGRDVGRRDEYAVRRVVQRRNGIASGHYQLYAAIDAAVEIQIARCGQHVVAVGVAYHGKKRIVGAERHLVGNLERKGRPPAAMLAHVAAVDEYVGHALHAVELDKYAPAAPLVGDIDVPAVIGRSLQIYARRSGGVEVPCMGQRHVTRTVAVELLFEEKQPPVVERVDLAGIGAHTCQRAHKQRQSDNITFHNQPFYNCKYRNKRKYMLTSCELNTLCSGARAAPPGMIRGNLRAMPAIARSGTI